MPDSSPSPPARTNYGSRDAVPAHASSAVNRPQKRRLRLPRAAADPDFAVPRSTEIGPSAGNQETPANADVAQLVEHFTRNEGVPGSNPGVGSRKSPAQAGLALARWCARSARLMALGHLLGNSSAVNPGPNRAEAITSWAG